MENPIKPKISYLKIFLNNNYISIVIMTTPIVLLFSAFALSIGLMELDFLLYIIFPIIVLAVLGIFNRLRRINECFDGVEVKAIIENYTNFIMARKHFAVTYSYSIKGKAHTSTDVLCAGKKLEFSGKYKKYDEIRVMVSEKDNRKSCVLEMYGY